ncbi:hypothetical protein A3A09_00540 [Candidatus Nomurabacteria bacterium RIFCSPLOWO2_01_FULL_42_20]|uniref:Fido domain-containing protein n=1 Tax=Candidatus Nomurabacteria bacterium RIFCSPHIGHO2_01_FULL_42_16 TaxID=1801743 RepID=A0A1F6VJ32_9BACT|nr:MAG: hypothetical protein A2824_02760 [Candidatus Nomurabacteria bacterium RIFCSPHIGHO2_01_FULL_42_16]OGI91910.1 MAG: hypothetical protein A3A09_00540 [Candidatus Nomurabacteria bacterium RIFCSPLOWO2_01_FULL_42_20]
MFEPKYTISAKLLQNIKRITEIITDLNNRRFSEIVLARFEKEARGVSAFASTSIEGNPLPLTDVKKILKSKPENVRDSEQEVLNYNQALTELNKLIKSKKISFNLSLISEIQGIIINKLIEKHRLGKIRGEPVFVNDPRAGKTIYWPPDYKDVSILLTDLIEYTNSNRNKIDPLILAGIFHKQFVIIHPFMDGNGRTVRLLTKILLADLGLNTFNLFSFENYYNKNITKYFAEVGVLGNYYEIKDSINFTAWLEYFTDGIIDELLRVKKELEKENISPREELKDYHQEILDYIKKHGYITDKDYAKLTKRARPTRNLDFRKLINLGLIKKLGRGKATYYKF